MKSFDDIHLEVRALSCFLQAKIIVIEDLFLVLGQISKELAEYIAKYPFYFYIPVNIVDLVASKELFEEASTIVSEQQLTYAEGIRNICLSRFSNYKRFEQALYIHNSSEKLTKVAQLKVIEECALFIADNYAQKISADLSHGIKRLELYNLYLMVKNIRHRAIHVSKANCKDILMQSFFKLLENYDIFLDCRLIYSSDQSASKITGLSLNYKKIMEDFGIDPREKQPVVLPVYKPAEKEQPVTALRKALINL
jgi:hypothetical protein